MADNKQIDLRTIKFSEYSIPDFKEEKNSEMILFGTKAPYKNLYPQYLLNLFNSSPINGSIIKSKINYIAGAGLEIDTTGLSVANKSILLDGLKQVNKYKETVNDCALKSASDFEIFGGCRLEIIWNAAGTDFEYYHVDFSKLRTNKDKSLWFYCDDWSVPIQKIKADPEKYNYREIPVFNPEKRKGSQIYYLDNYCPGNNNYPLPNYIQGVNYAECDSEISVYDLQRIKSGFFIGTIMTFFGSPDDEQKQQLFDNLKEMFQGADKANSLMMLFAANKDLAIDIKRLESDDLDKQFTILKENTERGLVWAHRIVSNVLFGGQPKDGALAGRADIIEAWSIFNSNYVIPHQKVLARWINDLLEYKGFKNRLKFKSNPPYELFDQETLLKVMTREEIREKAGLPKEVSITKMSAQLDVDQTIEIFARHGLSINDFEIVTREEQSFGPHEDLKLLYRNILDLISKDPLISDENIAKALKTNKERVKKAIDSMIESEMIIAKKDERIVSEKAQSILDEQGSSDLELRYSYEWRKDVKRDIKTSRDFCKKLLSLDKLYTREDIENISSIVGYDVTTPYCRHVWVQNIVRKKK
jgi:hypothetical protein